MEKKGEQQAGDNIYTCNEYREEMILAGMQRQLQRPDLSKEQRQKLIEEIRELERKMGM